jgi:hypothetical protein
VGAGGAPSACGNERVDPGEECDEGDANGVDAACSERCEVRCEPSLFLDAAATAKDPVTHHCYALVAVQRSFRSAATSCETRAKVAGFQLASVRTVAELDFVRSSLPLVSDTWIGLRDEDPADGRASFDWVDEAPPGFVDAESKFWAGNQPDDFGDTIGVEDGEQECVQLAKIAGYRLDDSDCPEALPYVCEYAPVADPD